MPRERYARARAARLGRHRARLPRARRCRSSPSPAPTGSRPRRCWSRRCCARPGCARAPPATSAPPALGLVGAPLDVAVLEVSSFQLEAVEAFRPRVAVVLNVTPDHLDRHASFEAYAAAKARLLAQQRPDDTAVLSVDDPVRARARRAAPARACCRSGRRAGSSTAPGCEAGCVVLAAPGGARERLSLAGLRLAGPAQPRERARRAARRRPRGRDRARRAIAPSRSFEGLPHRIEPVARARRRRLRRRLEGDQPGRRAARARAPIGAPLVWIAGGRDKGLDLRELADAAPGACAPRC